MISDIQKKVLQGIPLTDSEANEFLSYFCNIIRKNYGMVNPMDPDCKICVETSRDFGILMLMQYGCDTLKLNIKEQLEIPLTHHSNVVFLDVDGKKKTYLVDMTYSQFFGEKIILDDDRNSNGSGNETVFKRMEKEQFVEELRQNGFVELDEEILKKYIDAFLDLCKVKDKNVAYENINKVFGSEVLKLDFITTKIATLKDLKNELLEVREPNSDKKIK